MSVSGPNVACRPAAWLASSPRLVLLQLLILLGLAGCGGGGGSGAAGEQPGPETGHAKLLLTPQNVTDAAVLSSGYGGVALAIAQVAVDWRGAAPAAAGISSTTACPGGGSRAVSWFDLDSSNTLNAGDRIDVALNECYLKPLEDRFSGNLAIHVEADAAYQQSGTITFGPQFGVRGEDGEVRLGGGLRYLHRRDRLAAVLQVYSATAAFNITYSGTASSRRDVVEQLDARRELRRDTARVGVSMKFHLDSDVLGGSLDVHTSTPLQAWFDTYPDAGDLVLVGSGERPSLLTLPTGQGSFYVVLAGDILGTVPVDDAAPGYLWSADEWLPDGRDPYLYNTAKDVAGQSFRALAAPTVESLRPNPGALTWQYSRPLAAGTLKSAKFARVGQSSETTWAASEITADLLIEGSLVTVTPKSQLEPGETYRLVFDDTSSGSIADTFGAVTSRPALEGQVAQTISVAAHLEGPGLLVSGGGSLAIDASGSTAGGVPASTTRWRQLSGPSISIAGTESPRVLLSAIAGAGSGKAVIEVEVGNAAGEIDRQSFTLTVLESLNDVVVIGYRAGTRPQNIFTSADAEMGSSSGYAHYLADLNVVDVWLGVRSRFLASLPSGTAWAIGGEHQYGTDVAGARATWLPLELPRCMEVDGRFSVLEFSVDATGALGRLAIDFEETCRSTQVKTVGSIRYNSIIPIRS